MKNQDKKSFCKSVFKFGPILLFALGILITGSVPARGQQLSPGNTTDALVISDVRPAPSATPTPMPDMPGMKSGGDAAKRPAPSASPTPKPDGMAQSPTATPEMPGMKSTDDPAKKAEMDDGMGNKVGLAVGVLI